MNEAPNSNSTYSKKYLQIPGYIKTTTISIIALILFFGAPIATIITKNIGYAAGIIGLYAILGGIFARKGKNITSEIQMDIIRILFICIGSLGVIISTMQFTCPYVKNHTENLAMCKDFPVKN